MICMRVPLLMTNNTMARSLINCILIDNHTTIVKKAEDHFQRKNKKNRKI